MIQTLLRSAVAGLALAAAAQPTAAQTISGDVTTIDVGAGGVQTLTLSAPAFANQLFFLAGTTSGTSPGFVFQGFPIPLNPVGSYFLSTLFVAAPQLSQQLGLLDAGGIATVTFTVPAGTSPSLVGVTVSHAYVVLNTGPLTVVGASNASNVLLTSGGAAQLVINEVDYDQPSTDTEEFIEIYNAGASAADLTNVVLELINGNGETLYATHALSAAGASLPAGGYLVIGSSPVIAGLPGGTLSIDLGPNSNLVQNGAPDGMRLLDGLAVLDQMSYEGDMSTTEGTGAGADDFAVVGVGLSRLPNGTDTNDNSADFVLTGITPGAANL
jgi:hypothetical protein